MKEDVIKAFEVTLENIVDSKDLQVFKYSDNHQIINIILKDFSFYKSSLNLNFKNISVNLTRKEANNIISLTEEKIKELKNDLLQKDYVEILNIIS